MHPSGNSARVYWDASKKPKAEKVPGSTQIQATKASGYPTVANVYSNTAATRAPASSSSAKRQSTTSPGSDLSKYPSIAPTKGAGLTATRSYSGGSSSSSSSSGREVHSQQREPDSQHDIPPARSRRPDPAWYILQADKEVKGRQADTILSKHHAPDSKKVLRGALLRHVRTVAATILVATLADVEFECTEQEVGRLTNQEKDLLLALPTDAKRFIIFREPGLLEHAMSLRKGSHIWVKHKNSPSSAAEDAEAVVRYIGPLKDQTGTRFGLELLEARHRGHGTSNGEFGRRQLFTTEPDCAIFVSIDKLVSPPRPSVGQEARRASSELPTLAAPQRSCGEIELETNACFQEGSSWKTGKVVFMAVPPGETECHVAIEMPKTGGISKQPWNGYWDKKCLFYPKEGMHTYFIPVTHVLPEHIFTDQDKTPMVKEQPKVKAEPFYASAAKPRKALAQAGMESRAPLKTRRDISDSSYPESLGHSLGLGEVPRDDLATTASQLNDGAKHSIITKFKARRRKANNGSREEDATHSIGELDYLENDVMEEITKVIYLNWRTMAYSLYMSNEEIELIERLYATERERTVQMLTRWQGKPASLDKFSQLTHACRKCNFGQLADSLEQGLDDDTLMTVALGVRKEKVWPLGQFLNISPEELERLQAGCANTVQLVRMLLAKWRMRQSHSSDKIFLLSKALETCGLKQLALEVARGLDDDLMLNFAIQIGHNWKILAFDLNLRPEDVGRLEDFAESKQPYQMLMLWRQRLPRKQDLLGELSKGLRKAGMPQLAKELVQGVDDELIYHVAALTSDGVWEDLAQRLGLPSEALRALKAGATSEVETAVQALRKWRERHDYTEPRFPYLMAALRDCRLGSYADTLEEDQRLLAEEEEERSRRQSSTRQAAPAPTKPNYVSRELLIRVSQQLDYKLLCRAVPFPSVDFIEIENRYPREEQRVFVVLDRWKQQGEQGRRTVDELLKVLAITGGSASLINEVMSTQVIDKKEGDFLTASAAEDAAGSAAASPLGSEAQEVMAVNPDLEVESMVEFSVRPGGTKQYGVIRWIGQPQGRASKNLLAGIELETPLAQGTTDGTFLKKRYFHCEPNKGMFVYLYNCRPDSRFPSQSQTFRVSKRQTSQDFGGFESPMVQGMVDPPESLHPDFVGMRRGIQGDQNSCYLDTTLFSMFAFNSVFDPLLHRMQGKDDLQLYAEVQRILREGIVNPLRKNGFVRADRILQLREHLDDLGTTKGLMSEEKDPEEFLHTLLNEVFKSQPLLRIRHGDSQEVDLSNIYQIFLDKDESYNLPTVEQLLLQSFQEHNLKLVEAPTCMIVQMPRFGKDYKMYSRIVPSLQIDITNIIENYPRQCVVCGTLADKECPTCKKEAVLNDMTHSYCTDCFHRMHLQKRHHHQPQDVFVTDAFLKEFGSKRLAEGLSEEEVDQHRQKLLTPRLMDLFAVVCIRTSHYVAFVKAGREIDSEWVFFDSMADRQGDQQGYNIPQVTHLKDFRSWATKELIEERVKAKQLTELMERLLGDAYICMYADSDKRHMTYV